MASAGTDTIDFYPHSPRGERQFRHAACGAGQYFYPHSPRGERRYFRGADYIPAAISIHTPREGSDLFPRRGLYPGRDFYPHSPRGERHKQLADAATTIRFLSTLPARGATRNPCVIASTVPFLSTLPARGATFGSKRSSFDQTNFYPHSPRGARRSGAISTMFAP